MAKSSAQPIAPDRHLRRRGPDAVDDTGHIGMTEPAASALAHFPCVQLRPYLPPARRPQQAEKVVGLLRGLVDFFVDAPMRLPPTPPACTPG